MVSSLAKQMINNADVVLRVGGGRMTITKALKLVEQEYERAKKLEFVRNPIAYALHKVWEMADREN